jgi:cyclic beta-1,2-glucan synthetase
MTKLPAETPASNRTTIAQAVHELENLLHAAVMRFNESSTSDSQPAAAQWLLDNYYVVQQALRQIREDMPQGFFQRLPVLADGPLAGYPRIYSVARELIITVNVFIDSAGIQHISDHIRDYPAAPQPLTMAELWALPVMLRFCCLQALSQTVCRINAQPCEQSWPEQALPADVRHDDVVANAVLSLRTLSVHDWSAFFEAVSRVEQIMRGDPAGAYAGMDKETRDRYRKVVERLSRASGNAETFVAESVVALASEAQTEPLNGRRRHIGYYLIDDGRPALESRIGYRASVLLHLRRWAMRNPTFLYLGSIFLISGFILLGALRVAGHWGASPLQLILCALLVLVPALTIAVSLVNWAVSLFMPPRTLPKMDFSGGIPDQHQSLVVIPALLSSAGEVRSLLRQIELHYLRNAGKGLSFALLTDFVDATQKVMPEDDALLQQASTGIRALNKRYANDDTTHFWLLHRERRWNAGEARWMGWERKRGKLNELNRLLRGATDTSFIIKPEEAHELQGVRYVITLDADTILLPQDANRLVGTLAHPMNQAIFDESGRVVSGYTLLQPRTEITPASAKRSRFTRIFVGDVGLDLYTRAVSNVYQDLFGAGIYIGKGIYDVDAFERSLRGRVPENALLSHDLFEGIHGRAGLVTDIILFEEYPPHYLVYVRRSHRWIRGDWQLLPWLMPRVPRESPGFAPNILSVIDRWKILDNLRRSLLAPMLLLLFLSAWLGLPGPVWGWTLFGVFTPAVPVLTGALGASMRLWRERRRRPGEVSFRGAAMSLRDGVLRWLLELAFIPYETLLGLGGIALTLVRVFVTRRNMLEWVTAAQAAREGGHEISRRVVHRRMMMALAVTSALVVLIILINVGAFLVALPLLVAWLLSPEIAYFISRPIVSKKEFLTPEDRHVLRKLARRTWLFFEQFVGPEDHWLPPDHFQESPLGQVTPHTSPTNIGLMLLSSLSAYDMGYISAPELLSRVRLAFESLDALEQHRGHWLNWYDTRTLQPLSPRYVSTVDSGNLAGSLIALQHGLRELRHAHVLRPQYWDGWLDTLDMLSDVVEEFFTSGLQSPVIELRKDFERVRNHVHANKNDPAVWLQLFRVMTEDEWPAFHKRLLELVEAGAQIADAETLQRLRLFADRAHVHLENARRDLDRFMPAEVLRHTSGSELTYAGLSHLCERAQKSLPDGEDREAPCEQLKSASIAVQHLMSDVASLESRAGFYVDRMDFSFLYDVDRQVFHIGYNAETARLDANYYDLLASEARIASLIAIAKNDVPPSHWLHMNRPFTEVNGTRCLLSWSATMFEYLMPSLLLHSQEGTLLDDSSHAAVQHQIDYVREKRMPWGISESGYYAFDAAMNYQYRAFGVPGLGFKRDLADDLVIAPYASVLALPYAPHEVVRNVRRLMLMGMQGTYGLYEAVDYTAARMPLGKSHAVVQSYMAHHQGMILVSLSNYLLGNPMVNRCHADPRVQSVELLLQERIPYDAPLEPPQVDEIQPPAPAQHAHLNTAPWRVPVISPVPRVHLLSNGRMSSLVTSTGSGVCQWKDLDITRWQPDPTLEPVGMGVYVQEVSDDGALGEMWSATYLPAATPIHDGHVEFSPHMAEYYRRDKDVAITMQIAIAPDDDVEIRRIMLTNHGDAPRKLRLASYAEIALAAHGEVLRHPAFSKLFVESEYVAEQNTLLFHRRPRSQREAADMVHMAHVAVIQQDVSEVSMHEISRAEFIGRNSSLRSPHAMTDVWHPNSMVSDGMNSSPANGAEAPLDPIASLGLNVMLQPHQSIEVGFLTLVAPTRLKALQLADRYSAWHMIDLAYNQAHTRARNEMNNLGLNSDELANAEQLLSTLLYPVNALRAAPEILSANTKGQNGLWAFGISGDYPILLLRMSDVDDLSLAQDVLKAHAYWRKRQLKIDLVILNQQGSSYNQELGGVVQRLLVRMKSENWINRRGGIFVLNADQMGEADRVLVESAAHAILDAAKGTLASQLKSLQQQPAYLPHLMPTGSFRTNNKPADELAPVRRPTDLLFDNGTGGFSADGREYVIYLEPGRHTPAPWVNVIANPGFGCVVSETGSGYTWASNSSENRLTPWSNDPVCDPPGEALYLRDEETVDVWSPMPAPCPAQEPYLIRHGAGYSAFEHHSHLLRQNVTVFVAPDAPVKIIKLRLENASSRSRRITATYYAEWVLGTTREAMQMFVLPDFDGETQALLAQNPYNAEFGGRVAFAVAGKALHGLTADRTEFLGRVGDMRRPEALNRIGLSSRIEPGLDPCAALQVHIDLAPGATEEIHFVLGQGAHRDEALKLAGFYKDADHAEATLQMARSRWDDVLGCVQVRTPEAAMNLLLNRWLLYQSLSSRIWGRTALYQSSGAFGYRDQLQDVMALMHGAPELAREHILCAARHQFEAGDVLHWWHPPSGRGVRTRCSDDLLWLPFVTAHYVTCTGDKDILEERVPFLKAQPLRDNEEERYSIYPETEEAYTLHEHCRRAIQKGSTAGVHGLPLMGSGDWNDGMNRVGIEGKGESVWLGWFLHATLTQYADLCSRKGDGTEADEYRNRAKMLSDQLERHAWDGQWYLRAFYDDGSPLGSHKSDECQIDAIAQSWSAISGAGDPQRVQMAMQSVLARLVRPDDELILLFAPPFDKTPHDPGYIKGYVPGIRENGGQYTHAAIWTAWAFAELGDGEQAEALFRLLNPIHHSNTDEASSIYKVEPYAIAADVYGVPPHTGRGGWTWYTGSAAWFYRLGVEAILGLRRKGNELDIDPCMPPAWPGYSFEYRFGKTIYEVEITNKSGISRGVAEINIDGVVMPSVSIPLRDDGDRHSVKVTMGAPVVTPKR